MRRPSYALILSLGLALLAGLSAKATVMCATGRASISPATASRASMLPGRAVNQGMRQKSQPCVENDLLDYPPGTTAQISGYGFQPGEIVQLQVLHIDGTPNTGEGRDAWQVAANANSNIAKGGTT